MDAQTQQLMRKVPSVDALLKAPELEPLAAEYGRGLVADSIRRLKLREGTDRPTPVPPGEPVSVRIPLPPLAWTFCAGHRIRLVISGSNHPRFERNSHTGADRFDEVAAVPAEITLHAGGDADARLVLPVRT